MKDLLRQVSRSFYLTLRILPQSIRPQLSIAYLIARASDTVADTQLVAAEYRMEALLQLRKSIQDIGAGMKHSLPDFGNLQEAKIAIASEGTAAEKALLENLGDVLNTLSRFLPEDRIRICGVLDTITQGQELDLIRFSGTSATAIGALRADEELDRYTYLVAGCVGEFWTHMCRAHLFQKAVLNDTQLLEEGIRFGKGLQLVNILRDLPKDLRQGRCYIPAEELSQIGLAPKNLLDRSLMARFRPLYDKYLQTAEDYLASGWRYTAMLPYRHMRVRLACAWPILLGIRTVQMLRSENVLDESISTHIHHAYIRMMMVRSILLYPSRKAWHRLFDSVRLEKPSPFRGESTVPWER
jgi:farnesyl-diphosphate farnesyltransferase